MFNIVIFRLNLIRFCFIKFSIFYIIFNFLTIKSGMIITAGGMDAHVHFICPQICDVALYSGLTTMLGGGTGGPAAGTCATTCTPSTTHMKMMLQVRFNIDMILI